MLDGVESAVERLVEASRELAPLLLVGAPLRVRGQAVQLRVADLPAASVLGVVPKSYLPNYREFYEKRQFAPPARAWATICVWAAARCLSAPICCSRPINVPGFAIHVEICEDLWTPMPPRTYAAMAGATVLANLSASNITIGKADYRRDLCAAQSGRCLAAYLYRRRRPRRVDHRPGLGRPGADLRERRAAGRGRALPRRGAAITADVDLERLRQERMRLTSFNDALAEHQERSRRLRRVPFDSALPAAPVPLDRRSSASPMCRRSRSCCDERCYEAYKIQVHGLMKRLDATGIQKVVIGVSGGLDSTQALIVAARTCDRLGLPRDEHPRLHHARLRHQRAHPAATPGS